MVIKITEGDCMSTKGEFITYPVGQGLFYAGKLINDNKEQFNFINIKLIRGINPLGSMPLYRFAYIKLFCPVSVIHLFTT